ncbi:MAG: tRNA (adenosine(37)-N6)-threonylcarbamoyltransferase complex transferase subunit TsaD [Candidatus Liptonbacteria bacterium]|nr:tRNA (adenosine(37)-N6)-threonylcarbamoyltransferase complex transferase subunit TsaD [Candidatus Liptonbacteria bacterium]
MNILAIETSCDETAIALLRATGTVRPQFTVLKNAVASQIEAHRPFGGVVPNIAKREHHKWLPIILRDVIGENERKAFKKIDLVVVTQGPGLEPALWEGIEFAKTLAKRHKKPLIGTNHLEGHLYSFLLMKKAKIQSSKSKAQTLFPAVALIVSGGHTILLRMDNLLTWKKLGETLDDAAGEAFDKVARILGLPYPGGPEIQKASAKGNPAAVAFPRPMLNRKNYNFSFSGLKTAVLYYMRDHKDANKADVAASFQQAVVDTLVGKTMRAVAAVGAKSILLSGGVAANQPLRDALAMASKKNRIKFLVPEFKYNTDNASMIAVAGYMKFLRDGAMKRRIVARGNLSI